MNKYKISAMAVLAASLSLTSCDLDEYNPNSFTLDTMDEMQIKGTQTLCYQPIYAQLYSVWDFIQMAELGTDIWWCSNNATNTQESFYYEGLTSTTGKGWDKAFTQLYSALGSLNTVIHQGSSERFEGNKNVATYVAEARFLRGYYHLLLTTYYGPITLVTSEPSGDSIPVAKRNTLSQIYDFIVEDLQYAVENLPLQQSNRARATKKSAQGMLCRAYIQGAGQGLSENGKSYWERAKEESEKMINEPDTYGAFLYSDVSDLWSDGNNRYNRESLFIAAGQDACDNADLYNYSSSFTNKLFTYCYFNLEKLSAISLITSAKNDPLYGRTNNSLLAPSEYLLHCYNPTWDKRWENSFQTAFFGFSQVVSGEKSYNASKVSIGAKASSATSWQRWGMDKSVAKDTIYPYVDLKTISYSAGGDQYPASVWPKGNHTGDSRSLTTTKKIYVVDYPLAVDEDRMFLYLYPNWADEYKDGYDKTGRHYCSIAIDSLFKDNAGGYRSYVENAYDLSANDASISTEVDAYITRPCLNKFIWNYEGVYYGSNKQIRNGDIAVMRMAEVYLIAAEAEQHLGNGAKAAEYLNVLRKRAARATATPADYELTTVTEDDILDEYARELCGEFQRWSILQRHHALKDRLTRYNGRAAKSFQDYMEWRPISATFLQQIDNKEEYGDNGYGTTANSGLEGFLQ